MEINKPLDEETIKAIVKSVIYEPTHIWNKDDNLCIYYYPPRITKPPLHIPLSTTLIELIEY